MKKYFKNYAYLKSLVCIVICQSDNEWRNFAAKSQIFFGGKWLHVIVMISAWLFRLLLTISAPVKLDFSTVLIVRKGLVRTAGQQVVLHYYLVPLVLLEWPCDRDFLWIYIIFSLIVCFSDINRKIGQRIFDCATVDVWAARVIALICQRLQDIFPIIFSSFPVLCSILWFCQKATLTSIWCHSWSLNWILMSNFYLSK